MRDGSTDPTSSGKTLTNDLANSWVVVTEQTIIKIVHRNGLWVCRPRGDSLLQKRHVQARLKYANDNLESSSPTETLHMFGEIMERHTTQRTGCLQWNMVVGVLDCEDASVHRKLGISSSWKGSWRKNMWRFWKNKTKQKFKQSTEKTLPLFTINLIK